jgi:hypothetical protein
VLLDQGRLAEARRAFWREATSAAARGDDVALGEAALGLGGIWVHEHRSTVERSHVAALQRRALRRLDGSSPLAHRLRVRLAAEDAYVSGHGAPMLTALDDARRLNDPGVLAEALSLAHHCLLGPQFADARLAIADELIDVAALTGRRIDALMGLAWRTVDLFLAGDWRAGRSLRELRERLNEGRCDSLRHLVTAIEVMLAIRAGRLDVAELAADACYELGQVVGDADALGWYGAQLVVIRWLQGRSDEVLPLVADLAHSPTVPERNDGFVAALAALAAAAGDHGTARSALASLRSRRLGAAPPSSIWLATLLGIAEAAHLVGDVDAAGEVYQLLGPFADLPVMVSLAVTCLGSVHRPLGLAAWTLGDLDQAIEHLEAAGDADLALGNGPCHAIASAWLADALDQRDHDGDRARAATLRWAAIEAGERFGMHARVTQWRRIATAGGRDPLIELRRDGGVWRVRFGDRSSVVPHSVGMGYLAHLVANAGHAIPAIELASGFAMSGAESWQPVLDPETTDRVRDHIIELRSEIDDADACADLERAAAARVELDAVVEEMARATGLASRSRSFGRDAERARISVQKAIKRTIARLTQVDAELGRVLTSRVTTGTRCVYVTNGGT